MTEERKQMERLQMRVYLLEELLRRVHTLWTRCYRERSLYVGEPGSASHEFLKLVYKIEKTLPPTEQ
jgi:hypothetical protein